mmetsp:Transcript_38218/g.96145  ORF Transcript_38218/g.96145 Transcript_38218/m.96145 type:complete len:349 (+) Transcript_38218:588-1634(+)
MHGQTKIVYGSEAAKVRRQKKILAFQAATSDFESQLGKGDMTEAGFSLTTRVLDLNPEYYTAWNYRRRILQSFFDQADTAATLTAANSEEIAVPTPQSDAQRSPDKKKSHPEVGTPSPRERLLAELRYTAQHLAKHPKSYWLWFHRSWSCQQLHTQYSPCDWEHELELCTKFLNVDHRNFHCWNYRRWVASFPASKGTIAKEFEFTTGKIEQSFSNYSAWHQRSYLLPMCHTTEDSLQAALEEEFDFVKAAFYTDPSDQSAWFYHRWLVARSQHPDIEKRELEMCEELIELEPEAKWPLVTSVVLMVKLREKGFSEYEDRISVYLDKLEEVDPYRKMYYRSMRLRGGN